MDDHRPPNGVQYFDNQPLDCENMLTLLFSIMAIVYKFLQSYYKNAGFQNISCHIVNIFEKLAFQKH